jgi:hypothetical protein
MGGVGVGSGGHGAVGPVPKSLAERVLAGTATAAERREFVAEQARAKAAAAGKVVAPQGMSKDARRVWDRLAPHALAAHTLTAATVESFRQLCELTVKRDRVGRRIDREGWTVRVTSAAAANRKRKGKRPGAAKVRHPLLADYHRLKDDVIALLTRFRLSPMGRAMEFVEPVVDEPGADPFAEFEQAATEDGGNGDPSATAH